MIKKSTLAIFISLVIISYFLFLNFCQPLAMDDYWRAINDTLVNHNFWALMKQDYFGWTGRMSAQALVYLLFSKKFILISILIINTSNAICFYLFIIFSYKISTSNKYSIVSKEFAIYIFFFILMFGFTGFIGQVLWKTAAIQYFWGLTLVVTLYYFLIIKSRKLLIISFLSGCFIGLYNEQFVAVILLFSLSYLLESKLNKKNINKGVLTFSIGVLISGIILISAPGNYARMAEMSNNSNHSITAQVIHTTSSLVHSTWPDTKIIAILFVIFLGLSLTNLKSPRKTIFIYALALILSIFVMTPITYSYGIQIRPMLIYYIIFFIATMNQFYNNQSKAIILVKKIFKKAYLIFLIIIFYILINIACTYIEFHTISNQQDKIAIKNSNDNKSIIVPTYLKPNEIGPYGIITRSITCDTQNTNNQAFAEFYNLKSVKAKDC